MEKRVIFFAKLIAELLNGKMQYSQISIGYTMDQFNKAKMAYASKWLGTILHLNFSASGT
jgi:hypothetical protein